MASGRNVGDEEELTHGPIEQETSEQAEQETSEQEKSEYQSGIYVCSQCAYI